MPRKQDGSRKSDIADAILKIAGREGIGALTMERLARELGVTSGALFRHFPTRASMLNEAAEHGGIPQLVFSEQFGKALPPKGSRAVREAVLRTRDFVVEALREAAAQGEVRRDIPAPELALTVIGTVFARSLFAAFDGGEGKPPQEPQARWTSLVRLLGAPPSASPSSPGRPSPTATPSTAPS
jgi:AcrR family transcriptional regulator